MRNLVAFLLSLCYDTHGTVVRNSIDITKPQKYLKNFKKYLHFPEIYSNISLAVTLIA